jgi:hypothetical protein
MKSPTPKKAAFPALLIITLVALVLSLIIALSFGPSRLPVHTVWEVIL